MADRAKHAFGKSSSIEAAKQAGKIDAYDILFLDGDTEPKVGWLDSQGNVRIVEDKKQIMRVETLPVSDGDADVIYVYNNECYVWDASTSTCVPVAKPADLTALEEQIATKVDETRVQEMIDESVASTVDVVEF